MSQGSIVPLIQDLEHSSFESNSDSGANPSFQEDASSLRPIDIPQNINTVTVITRNPIFASGTVLINLWKRIIVDMNVASMYFVPNTEVITLAMRSNLDPSTGELKIPDHSRHSMVLSLSSWYEFECYNTRYYADNVQRAGKIFIHFPLNQESPCNHNFVAKRVCLNGSCGVIAPFLDMRAVTSMINEYMSNDIIDGVLLHCHQHIERMLVFIGCCMVQGGMLVDEVLDIMNTLNLSERYQSYIRAYDEYLHEIN